MISIGRYILNNPFNSQMIVDKLFENWNWFRRILVRISIFKIVTSKQNSLLEYKTYSYETIYRLRAGK
jgi:hypothetical protein